MTQTQSGRAREIRSARRLVQAAGLIFYLLAIQGLATAGVGADGYLSGGSLRDLVLPATGGVLAACYAFVGFHLRRYRLWARNFSFAFAAISLFVFPVGTALGALIVFSIERANRAGVFPRLRPPVRAEVPAEAAGAAEVAEAAQEAAPRLRFEPDLSGARAEARAR
jgi:hypothetical protein